MDDSIWIATVAVFSAFVLAEGCLYLMRAKKRSNVQRILEQAKQETQEIVQLPMHNPHPQMQISDSGRLIFANPAALQAFPSLESQKFEHPILKGVTKTDSREVNIDNKTYQQTIAKTRVNGQEAYVIYCYDITDRKWFEREIQGAQKKAEKMRQEAEEAKDARGEFLANMSHELRTPMNGIIGLSDMLVEMGLDGEKQELIEAVNSSARNLLILLNDILDFSKIEAGELTMENIPFEIRKVVKQIESLQKPIASQKGLIMKGHVDDNLPNFLIGDPSRLQQILNNLISNALKFTEKGSVSLSVYGEEEKAGVFTTSIAVTDTGIGIPKDKQATVFQKFQQADASTARKYGGTGLGLAITKDLAELMQGHIKIESEEGVGTTFTVTIQLPIAEEQNNAAIADGRSDDIGINTQSRLLIVDDHPINLLFLRQMLAKIGFKDFDEATSGKQAIQYFSENNYNLIIMDCQMPEMDGYEAARNIRERQTDKTAPIIIAATADAMKGAEEKCKAAGMDDYISKPIDKDKLKHLLHNWIPSHHEFTQPRTVAKKNIIKKEECTMLQADGNDLIDWKHLREFTDGDPDIEEQIIDIFIKNLKLDVNNLHNSLQQENYQEWDSYVHKLYGASSHIGAKSLAKICDEGQGLHIDDVTKIHEIHKLILIEYKRINEFFVQKGKTY